ncbi:MAG: metal-dependent transcriptional regulator [Clostridiaceae bacterium]|mgnify:CR=1 FL=1|nr:metal-dependent transcriptional regulator [Clostridiaceae bacterium]
MKLQESGENYLEMIYVLSNQTGYVRSVDVANAMSFSKPSISRAMSILKKAGHIEVDKDGQITLTESGLNIARRVYSRHNLLTDYLIALGVSRETAAADACRMEHVISQETFEKIKKHIEQIKCQ